MEDANSATAASQLFQHAANNKKITTPTDQESDNAENIETNLPKAMVVPELHLGRSSMSRAGGDASKGVTATPNIDIVWVSESALESLAARERFSFSGGPGA